jgi:APA family basic amino acid/polyamine antiporter
LADPSSQRPSLLRGLSLLGAVALIVGNMVGTSIYTLPASLAKECGPLGIVAWILTAAGYLFIALVYAHLGPRYPRTGGPYVFAREAFGEFAGFLVVWAYWISATVGNAGIALAIVGYFAGFSGELEGSAGAKFALAQALVWGLTLVNVLGIKKGARLQIAVMFLNVVPLLALSALALSHFDPGNLQPFAPHGWGALPVGAAMIVWAYSGIESATVPAEEVAGEGRTIRRGTMIGYALGTLVFLSAALAVAGALPNGELSVSTRPMADVAARVAGPWGARMIGLAAIAAGMGTLNGWILMAGRIPVSAAQDGIFFERLARIHPRFRTPHAALLAGGAIASAMLFLGLSRTLLERFDSIVRFSVLLTLLPHLFAAAAQLLLARRDPQRYARKERRRAQIVAAIAFAFSMFTIYGVGPETALWGLLAVLAGIPLYVLFKTRAPPLAA